MDCSIGIVGKGFVLVAADTQAVQSIIKMKTDEDKILALDSHKLLALSGQAGDRVQFSEFIQANMRLYAHKHAKTLSTKAAANFTRSELATALRKGPYNVNLLLAGWDAEDGPSLYFMDYMATLHKMSVGAHGYGAYFSLATADKVWKPEMSLDEAMALMEQCIAEVKKRVVVAPTGFHIKVVDKDGVRLVASPGVPAAPGPAGA